VGIILVLHLLRKKNSLGLHDLTVSFDEVYDKKVKEYSGMSFAGHYGGWMCGFWSGVFSFSDDDHSVIVTMDRE